jgi:hypothetical protein
MYKIVADELATGRPLVCDPGELADAIEDTFGWRPRLLVDERGSIWLRWYEQDDQYGDPIVCDGEPRWSEAAWGGQQVLLATPLIELHSA